MYLKISSRRHSGANVVNNVVQEEIVAMECGGDGSAADNVVKGTQKLSALTTQGFNNGQWTLQL